MHVFHNKMVFLVLQVPCILGVNLTDVDLLEFLQQVSPLTLASSHISLHLINSNRSHVESCFCSCLNAVSCSLNNVFDCNSQLADTDGSSIVPPSVNRILNNKACRSKLIFNL